MNKKIVIRMWRGIVSEVYADDPDLDVAVIDEEMEPEEDEKEDMPALPAHKIYG